MQLTFIFSTLVLLSSSFLRAQTAPLEGEALVKQVMSEAQLHRNSGAKCGAIDRAAMGELKWSSELASAAQVQTDYLAQRPASSRASLHLGPAKLELIEDRIKEAGYVGSAFELALNDFNLRSPMSAWMGSAGHCSTFMTESNREIGIAYTKSASGRYFWIMLLGYEKSGQGSSDEDEAIGDWVEGPSGQYIAFNHKLIAQQYVKELNELRRDGIQCGTDPMTYNLPPVTLDEEMMTGAEVVATSARRKGSLNGVNVSGPLPKGTQLFPSMTNHPDGEATSLSFLSPVESLNFNLLSVRICRLLSSQKLKIGVIVTSLYQDPSTPIIKDSDVDYIYNGEHLLHLLFLNMK